MCCSSFLRFSVNKAEFYTVLEELETKHGKSVLEPLYFMQVDRLYGMKRGQSGQNSIPIELYTGGMKAMDHFCNQTLQLAGQGLIFSCVLWFGP